MFRIEIDTDNVAFDSHPRLELGRILREATNQVEEGHPIPFDLFDLNGNCVGSVTNEERGALDHGPA